ncbi:alkene reductase [Dyadobacter sp. CY261]|uniref:alkene reductase n=1 Tax=Dyadobacter sp. CY261 TaxID=2907203 RepID=UPI001F1BFEE6|nr:alkene reductase [Dyadobacter sp. CY261]MCF0074260.1 alkene reductase [Dyadobacter sp. CY261]
MSTLETTGTALAGTSLFTPITVGLNQLANRVVLAPLTRMRSSEGGVPNDLMAEYYSQRATPGALLIAEATLVSPNGHAYAGAPGILNEEQLEGWKKVVNAVHDKGAIIFLQLFHGGRQSHQDLQPDGGVPIGPSAIPHNNLVCTEDGWVPATQNREATIEEIHSIVDDFHAAANRAKQAGFDGIELHGANGYLIDQFLQDGSNQRTDEYGGSIENRVRLLTQVVSRMVDVYGADSVGVRLGPSGRWGEMSDSNPLELFTYAVEQLDKFGLAYLHLIEPRVFGNVDRDDLVEPVAAVQLRKVFHGPIIAAGGFNGQGAADIIGRGDADLVAFGRYYVANPDLVRRLREGLPLNPYDRSSFFGGTEVGCTDYPFYSNNAELV